MIVSMYAHIPSKEESHIIKIQAKVYSIYNCQVKLAICYITSPVSDK